MATNNRKRCLIATSEKACTGMGNDIKGTQPSLAANKNGHVVCVHNSLTNNSISYEVGILRGDTIQWRGQNNNFCDGYRPNVAINDDGQVLLVYNLSSSSATMKYSVARYHRRTW